MNREEQLIDDMRRIDAAINLLSEHFETVQIFTTRHEENAIGTVRACKGSGNYYARYGQVKQWVIQEERPEKEDQE